MFYENLQSMYVGNNIGNNWSYLGPVSIFQKVSCCRVPLTHWGRVTHICVNKLTIIGSDDGLSPGRRQAIIWTNAGILLIGPLGTNFSEIIVGIQTFSFRKNALENVVCVIASISSRPQWVKTGRHETGGSNHCIVLKFDGCLGSNVFETSWTFKRDWTILNTNVEASRLCNSSL